MKNEDDIIVNTRTMGIVIAPYITYTTISIKATMAKFQTRGPI